MNETKTTETLNRIRDSVKGRFERSKRVLSFDEYLELLTQNPYQNLRTAAQYVVDGIDSYGTEQIPVRHHTEQRFKIYDVPFEERARPLIGQEVAQNALHQILTGFTRAGRADKLVVLHGPNGSAKSSLVRTLFEGLEAYSKTDAGCLFTFSWVFPIDSLERAGLGFAARRDTAPGTPPASGAPESYAKLEPEKIGAIVRSELRESPICFIPLEERKLLFGEWMAKASPAEREKLQRTQDAFLRAEFSHKSAIIYEALLNECKGDWRRVLRHVRVERFYLSKKLRRGLITVEPQFSVDATLRQVTLDRSLANLPPALQSLNLFQTEGDLVDGNRGIIEYSDLLKRPPEHFKYLLGTCETGSVTLGNVIAFLDTVLLATTNDRQLDAFREHPDFNSFKARMEFIRVPYLLRASDEARVYTETFRAAAGTKEVLPHTARILALWAVLTRIKRPILKNKSPELVKILEGLTPLVKAKLYDDGSMPSNLKDEERRLLRGHIETLIDEQQALPYYEGLMGASARELKVVVQLAAQNNRFPTLGPNAILSELEKVVHRPLDFEYLRIEPNQGYHDYAGFLETVREEWLNLVDREMLAALNFERRGQIREFLSRYMTNVTHYVRGEKIRNKVTGKSEDADETLMREFEVTAGVMNDAGEFRRNLISRLGAWRVEHPEVDVTKGLPYDELFPDLTARIENEFRGQDVAKVKLMGGAILDAGLFETALGSKTPDGLSEGVQLAVKAYRGLQEQYGYGPEGAKEALVTLVRARYL